ncbi:hypothetical protein FA15DRAFT_737338 [Coprinopsis marcescibilis]|uniref:Phosphatidic acid phosphatase type 2/haloperoxidase domain-containing protein n=1 Tax=Coprinopsis marcescibilis TaxID=230819 RepID=A0A5C3KBV3_COPMA|nr:hypothetical protein FA15DRAFT_737338 [Coprinopsis marcescibilis]
MYLTHHYLIDVVGGACMATAFFYLFLPDEFKGAGALAVPYNFAAFVPGYVGGQHGRQQPRKNGSMGRGLDLDLEDRAGPSVLPRAEDYEFDAESSEEEGEMDITYRSPVPAAVGGAGKGKTHRHTASLVEGGGGRGEVYSSPVMGTFVFPPGAQPVR